MADLVDTALKRDFVTLKALLEGERNVDETDQYGDTALMAAASTDQEETLVFLLEKKSKSKSSKQCGINTSSQSSSEKSFSYMSHLNQIRS